MEATVLVKGVGTKRLLKGRVNRNLNSSTTNSALFPKKVNMPKTVQTQTEQSLFVVHKNPNFRSYVRASYMRAIFSVMDNILY